MTFRLTKKEYDYYMENCFFSDKEIKIIDMKLRGKCLEDISYETGYSVSRICQLFKQAKEKMKECE